MSRFLPSRLKLREELRQSQRALHQNSQNMTLSGWDQEPSHVFIEKINSINAISRTRDVILQRKTKFNRTKPSFYMRTESSDIDTLKLEALKLDQDSFDKQNTNKSVSKPPPKFIEAVSATRDFQRLFRSTKNGIIGEIDERNKTQNLRKRTMKGKIEHRPSNSIKELKKTLEKEWQEVQKFTSSRSCSRSWETKEVKLDLNASERIKSSMVRRRSRMMKFTIEDTTHPRIALSLTPQTSKLKLINKILKQKFQNGL